MEAVTTTVEDALDRLRRQDAAPPEPGSTLSIAEMAERTGVTAHTLRYYERMTGMPIRELLRYVELVGGGDGTVDERLEMLLAHRESVRAQLAELQFALDTIEFKIASYGGSCGR